MMKAILLAISSVCAVTSGNIVFDYVQPTCNYLGAWKGCLRGQVCLENNTCAPVASLGARQEPASAPPGRCGSEFGGATCDPEEPYGSCCSSHGWCGKTPQHCLESNGCQSGCSDATPSQPSPIGASSSLPGSKTQPISSSTIHSEPTIGRPPPTSSPNPLEPPTTDGTCGAGNGGTVCGDWHLGSCCSMYGFCGNTSAHCGPGCQSGPCDQAPTAPAPEASPAPMNPQPGSFDIIGMSGVPAMHAALLPNGRVVFLDKVENYTQIKLSSGYYAYSSEYDPETKQTIGLAYKTNAFCAGGSFMANGTLLSVGGNLPLTWLDPTVGDGLRGIRYLSRSFASDSEDGDDWQEPGNQLDTARWYPSVQTLGDGRLFVASGSLNGKNPAKVQNNNPTYEVLNSEGVTQGESIPMSLLVKAQPYYMYPFIHLLRDGTLFLFVSKNSEIFDVRSSTTVKTFPELPGDYRTYPNTGGSVLLPLSSADNWNPDIIICGGGAYQDVTSPTDPSCGRIRPLDDGVDWEMDSMPEGRGMVEGTLLPDGTVIWLNGCGRGAQGFGLARDPTLEALIYDPQAPLGQRWTRGASSTIPRLYHSVALLLLDGTLLIAGSNPVAMPMLKPDNADPFVTEFRVEVYTPPYLQGENADRRPTDVTTSTKQLTADSSTFDISFTAPANAKNMKVVLYHGGFVTHSLHMSHRMLFLDNEGWQAGSTEQQISVTMPPNNNIAPPGPYVVYITVDGVPSIGQFVMVS